MKKLAIFSVPRSGSTWLGEIFNSSMVVKYCFQPMFSYSFTARFNNLNNNNDLKSIYTDLLKTNDDFIIQKKQRDENYLPKFEKKLPTHLVFKEVRYIHLISQLNRLDSDLKFIFLIRNPIDVINSWVKAPKEYNSDWKINKELIYAHKKNNNEIFNFYGLDAWVKTTKFFEEFTKLNEHQAIIIRYEDLAKNTIEETKKLFQHANLDFDKQTKCFIRQSKKINKSDPYSVYRNSSFKNSVILENNIIDKIKVYINNNNLTQYLKH